MKNLIVELLIISILSNLDVPFEEAPSFLRKLADKLEKNEEKEE